MAIPEVLRNRDFDLYWGGVVLSQIGTRGAVAANLYQVYELTGSTAQVGLVGLAQAVALLVLSPSAGSTPTAWTGAGCSRRRRRWRCWSRRAWRRSP